MTTTDALLAVVHRGLTVRLDSPHPGLPVRVTVADDSPERCVASAVLVPDEAWHDEALLATLLNRMADQVKPRLDPRRLP